MKLTYKFVFARLSFLAFGIIIADLFDGKLFNLYSNNDIPLTSHSSNQTPEFYIDHFIVQEKNNENIKAIQSGSGKIIELSSVYQLGHKFEVNVGDRIECIYCNPEHGKIPEVISNTEFLLSFKANEDPKGLKYQLEKSDSIKYIMLMRKYKSPMGIFDVE